MPEAKADDGGRPVEEPREDQGPGPCRRLPEDRPITLAEADLLFDHEDDAFGIHPCAAIEVGEEQLDLSGAATLDLGGRAGRARQEAISVHRELPTQPTDRPTLGVDRQAAEGPIGQSELELAARRDHRGASGDEATIRPRDQPPAPVLEQGGLLLEREADALDGLEREGAGGSAVDLDVGEVVRPDDPSGDEVHAAAGVYT